MKSVIVVLLIVLVCSFSVDYVESSCAGSGAAPTTTTTQPPPPPAPEPEPAPIDDKSNFFLRPSNSKINYNKNLSTTRSRM